MTKKAKDLITPKKPTLREKLGHKLLSKSKENAQPHIHEPHKQSEGKWISFIKNNIVIETIHCSPVFAKMLLDSPKIIELTEEKYPERPVIGFTYDEATDTFTKGDYH